MRTKTLRGMTATAGVAAVMLAGTAATAAAATTLPEAPSLVADNGTDPEKNHVEYWIAYFTDQGFTGVNCAKDEENYGDGVATATLTQEQVDAAAAEGLIWLGLIVKGGPDREVYEMPEPGDYGAPDGKDISHVIACVGKVPDGTEPPGDDDDETEEPTGPVVETDGPASPSGPNMGLVGGAALVLAGAGAAGFAMRRRNN